MSDFNPAYAALFPQQGLSLGLMTPVAAHGLADLGEARRIARLADDLGFAALWTRDVPLMVPQGPDAAASALDDPFLWLGMLAAATERIAVGSAAIVLPLRHPLQAAKSALSLDRISDGRFVLGLGSGDRLEEFAAFGEDLEGRAATFRERWSLLRAALSPDAEERASVRQATGGFDVLPAPTTRIPMLVVGTARQSLQWIAREAEGWATYHREEAAQEGRIGLWQQAQALQGGPAKSFVQSMLLDLQADPQAPPEPLPLGLKVGRVGLRDYLHRVHAQGVAHVMFNLVDNGRPMDAVLREIGEHVLPHMLR
ncbi:MULTISPECIES: TIGR03571 family LLM class oxidoreductase [Stenotrophomonas]|uniref:TIGR03571 family LLM class oxidoreductase n=1 Tax=Stenotrophomonas maltophilia TaxID=40324 RepID=A0A2J0SMI6_STEMA|nr:MULTISPECIES: TIGR03571 family LLM class oxidoreductase [Stenotrophomonas]MBA0311696.1 TIGR03571 family LLM class oxidoreductase [Stenotrophomonas maltophilia]MBH1866773.1 TIGR03571 family LLM class oxidoreductase [Stenotrophomonas maltophilia]MDH1389335.1 TIGR03571 family LLM class oxidoreductase [Stenotrophomonas sp. GD03701]MDH1394330.1 TIGR03571 family LLM class oxidoreductase [Stenotrophomonas sp. GD03702]MDQ7301425.1 TIGR03571 family LLM class oxidoreductase [Stenotrophomonas sp. Sm05